jgi:hypothetical protein
MKASGSPFGWKLMNKKDHDPVQHLGKNYDYVMLSKPAPIRLFKKSH